MRQFSGEHIAALIVTAAAAALAVRSPRLVPARLLAAAILGAELVEYAANTIDGTWRADFNLPLQLTDAVVFVAAAALWTRRPLLVELLYFWALTASLQALLTPDLNRAFPSLFYFTYFVTHGGAVVAACLLVFGRGLVPRPGAIRRVFAATVAFACVAGVADVLTGGNYMYLREKPSRASLLDYMGPWPVYIVSAAALALVMFAALAAIARAAGPANSLQVKGSPESHASANRSSPHGG